MHDGARLLHFVK